jgi:glycosyltransferase involved in cell wall biosynthesis
MKILFLSRWFPYPTDNGAKLRIYNLLRGLAKEHEVHLLSFADDPANAPKAHLETFCRSVRVAAWKEYQPTSQRALLGVFSLAPRSLMDIYCRDMEKLIRQALAENEFDLIIPSQWQMAAYRHLFSNHPVLFEELEVGVTYGQYAGATSAVARLRAGLTWFKHRCYLRNLLSSGKPCTVVSQEERRLLKAAVPGAGPIHVIPNGVNLEEYAAPYLAPQPNSLIFTGSFRYRPNYEAMLWFIEQILPRIQAQIPGVTLTITGDSAGLPLPSHPGVTQTGFVPDVRTLLAQAWASVVPLMVGGGTRLKILEAMAIGTPVISTSKGAEGLEVRASEHLLISDKAEEFASQTIELLRNPILRQNLSARGRELVACHYEWRVIMPKFLKTVTEAAGQESMQRRLTGTKGP